MLILLPLLSLIPSALATGYFTNPAGNDGSLSVKTGDTIDISWTNVTDYDTLSLGYYSGSNQTITWLISNSISRPTSYRWTVDAVENGFNLADSSLFAFYVCKDLNFGDPFISSYFIIRDEAVVLSSTSASAEPTSATSTSTNIATATNDLPSVFTPSSNPSSTGTAATPSATGFQAPTDNVVTSSSLSTGAKAGIALGVIIGVLGFTAAAYMYFRQRRQEAKAAAVLGGEKSAILEVPGTPVERDGSGSSYEKAQEQKHTPYTPVQEVPDSSPGGGRAELGTGGDTSSSGRAELPGTSRI